MAESKYDLDALLEEIRKKKAEIENNPEPEIPVQEEQSASSVTSILESIGRAAEDTVTDAAVSEETVTPAEDSGEGGYTGSGSDSGSDEDPQDADPGSGVDDGQQVSGVEEDKPEEDADTTKEIPGDRSSKSRKQRRRSAIRSISRQLTGSFDAVSSEYTGEFVIGHPQERAEDESDEDIDFTRSGVEEHPLFTEKTASFNVIPNLDDEQEENRYEPADLSEEEEKGTLRLDDEGKVSVTQGILNIRENLDDNFRELFGDTVIVEHRDNRRKDRRKERLEEAENLEINESDTGYEESPDEVYEVLNKRSSASVIRAAVSGVAAIVIAVFTYIVSINGTGFGSTAAIVSAACIAVSMAVNFRTVFTGILDLFRFRADLTSLAGFAALLSFLEPVICLLTDTFPEKGYTACISAVILFMCSLGDTLKASRDLSSFRSLLENPQKYASSVSSDQSLPQMITSDLKASYLSVLMSRRTGYTDRFLNYCDSDDRDFNKARKVQPFIALAAVILGLISFFIKDLSAAEAFRVSALAAAISAPLMSSLMMELPIHKMQRKLSRMGAVVPGYAAAEDVASANCVVLEGRELFPREKVLLHGIKTFEKERIDQAILYAASVLIHSCDTMSHMFLKVIQGKTDMLFEADSVVYEEGLGFSFWVGQDRILVGRREMLESHEIEVPSRDYENRYTKASTRDAIYLAVAGKLYAMFVIGYSPDEEMTRLLHELVQNDISIIVRTRDFIISPEKISRMYDIPQSMVTMVRDSSMQELARMTEYTRHCPSALTHVGSVGAFLGGMIGCNNLLTNAAISAVIGLAGMLVGIVLSAVLAVIGGLDTVKLTSVLLFQAVWMLIHLLVVAFRKS